MPTEQNCSDFFLLFFMLRYRQEWDFASVPSRSPKAARSEADRPCVHSTQTLCPTAWTAARPRCWYPCINSHLTSCVIGWKRDVYMMFLVANGSSGFDRLLNRFEKCRPGERAPCVWWRLKKQFLCWSNLFLVPLNLSFCVLRR